MWLLDSEKVWGCVYSFWYSKRTWQTDGRTDRRTSHDGIGLTGSPAKLQSRGKCASYRYVGRCTPVFIARCHAVTRCPSVPPSVRPFVCLSVCLSVTRRYSIETAKRIIRLFHHRVAILVLPYQTVWQDIDGDPHKGDVECRGRVWKSNILHYLRNDTR